MFPRDENLAMVQEVKIADPIPVVIEKPVPVEIKTTPVPVKVEVKKPVEKVKPTVKPIVKKKPVVKPVKTKTTYVAKGQYHLIAGAFGVDGNAEKLKAQLAKKGVEAVVLPKTGKMTYVSVASANSREALKTKEVQLKSKLGQSFWVLKR
jgi:cell division protein FtsN